MQTGRPKIVILTVLARCKHSCHPSCPREAIIKEREKFIEEKPQEMARPLLNIVCIYHSIHCSLLVSKEKKLLKC